MKKYLNQQDMKDANSNNVFRLIRKKGPITRRMIESETGLSWGAVSNVTARLIELGYVREVKSAETPTAAGRTPISLEVNAEHFFAIGVDVNRSGFRAVLMDLGSTVVYALEREARCEKREELLSEVISMIREVLDFADGRRVLCIGVSMQGTVDAEKGVSVYLRGCAGWESVPLAAILEETFGIPTFLEHDPHCTLYAHSVPRRIREAILVRIDRGIGMAVMLNGRIFDRYGALELGHTVAVPGGAPCSCGKRGCLEAYASMTGLAENAGMPFRTLASLARSGYGKAMEPFTAMAHHLALAIANAAQLLNVDEIVLSGNMLAYRDLFYDELVRRAGEIDGDRRLRFSETDVGNAALGGAMIALDRYTLQSE